MIPVTIRTFEKLQPYAAVFQAMKGFTEHRDKSTTDEIWLLEHPPVFTQGQAGKEEHIKSLQGIPLVQSDRGGQVTYHGPGQQMIYLLFDLKRHKMSIRCLVSRLENSVIECLAQYGLKAVNNKQAPGVYIDSQKIASIGLRVKKGCSYHGLALNVEMELAPYQYINPCGFPELIMTQLANYTPIDKPQLQQRLILCLKKHFSIETFCLLNSKVAL